MTPLNQTPDGAATRGDRNFDVDERSYGVEGDEAQTRDHEIGLRSIRVFDLGFGLRSLLTIGFSIWVVGVLVWP